MTVTARLRLFLALAFAFAIWSAVVLGIGGRACTPQFEWWAAVDWWKIYTLLGFLYMVPVVALLTGIAYLVTTRVRFFRHPASFALTTAGIAVCTFATAVLLTPPNGRCVWP